MHNDQTYFDIKIYRREHLESKLKLSNMCVYFISQVYCYQCSQKNLIDVIIGRKKSDVTKTSVLS